MQGLWVEALRSLSEMARRLGADEKLAQDFLARAEATREATEKTYWLADRGFYAFATNQPRAEPRKADPGPNRAVRQSRMDELDRSKLVDEDTVMPAVALWWRALEDERAQEEIDRLGSGHAATDWGARLVTDESRLYDPLSYHHGSVWPLFTGWASVGAYRYGRPHVGFQALAANVLLKRGNALGYVTELLSGDFHAPFGRSSHHQVWSEAMVVAPVVRGLFGLEAERGGGALRFAPQLPADWGRAAVRRFAAASGLYDFALTRGDGRLGIKVTRRAPPRPAGAAAPAAPRLFVAPAFPLDARIRSATVNGRAARFAVTRSGDVQRAEVSLEVPKDAEVVFNYEEGTDVYAEHEAPAPGARSRGLRILRARADAGALRLVLEGLAGHTYALRVRTPKEVEEAEGVTIEDDGGDDLLLRIEFEGPPDVYTRREVILPLRP